MSAQITTLPTPAPPAPPPQKEKKPQKENVQWMWQYAPPPADGRENALVLDPRFRPFLAQYFTAPQNFWGDPRAGYKPLPEAVLDFVSVPEKVTAEENRYLTITGCVFRFCPNRGMIWVDFGVPHPLVVFAAIDWNKTGKVPSEPDAEYNLWVFSNRPIEPDQIPAALKRTITRWTGKPPLGGTIIQVITKVTLVDPDGQQHPIEPQAIGANSLVHLPNSKEQP
jgi:hypothetical protein